MPEGRSNNDPPIQQADKLVRDLAERGIPLDYSPTSLGQLEEAVSRYPIGWSDQQQTLALLAGAYFGEVIRRNLGGQWYEHIPPDGTTALLVNEENQLMVFPYSVLARRLREGGKTLPQLYEHVVAMSTLKMKFQIKQPDAPQE